MTVWEWLAVNFDLPILDQIANTLHCDLLNAVMPIITMFGDAGIFWIAWAAVLLIFPKTRKIGLSMGIALILGLLVCNLTLKPLVARIRPYEFREGIVLLVETPSDFSFPSGHTIASFEAATALAIHNRKLGIPALILACLIAFSRLYLYVHYVTDVLVSVGLGIGFAFLASWLVKKGFAWYEARKAAQ